MNFASIAIVLVVGYLGLFIITKILGKGTISQLTPFDFVAAILLGELVGSAVFDQEIEIQHLLYALFIWFLLVYGTEIISQKFKSSRKLLEGEPAIVIHQGKLQREVLKKNKLDINQLQHLLRVKNAFSIREVEHAILETDGQLSVLKKMKFDSPTMADLELPFKPVILPVTLIIDGEVLWDKLRLINKDEAWLTDQLKANSINSYKEIFYADYKANEGIFIDKNE
ncbi:DUF421 domain-containing protein [Halobacillus seohaensis]|uniref:DUF421 domain-containing protein n=1 Tax=Halobacillus seohaensis TaxID=447421 RepID=A0ABW2EIP7_9BACI